MSVTFLFVNSWSVNLVLMYLSIWDQTHFVYLLENSALETIVLCWFNFFQFLVKIGQVFFWDLVVTSKENHRITYLFNTVKIFHKLKKFEYHQIKIFK